ncbi:MAG: CxxC-x17-CxxC domain-containing protein [Candidatus Dojkabacteria bacterium]
MRDDRNNRYSDNNRGGGFGRRDERSSFNNNRGGSDDRQMFPAVCDNCGKDCEVPFRPNGSKPVFCNDCFRKMGGNDRDENSDRFDFKTTSYERPSFEKPSFEKRDHARVESKPTNSINDVYVKQQFDVLNTKLNKILAALETQPEKKAKVVEALKEVKLEMTPAAEVAEVKEKKPKKAAVKKTKKAE